MLENAKKQEFRDVLNLVKFGRKKGRVFYAFHSEEDSVCFPQFTPKNVTQQIIVPLDKWSIANHYSAKVEDPMTPEDFFKWLKGTLLFFHSLGSPSINILVLDLRDCDRFSPKELKYIEEELTNLIRIGVSIILYRYKAEKRTASLSAYLYDYGGDTGFSNESLSWQNPTQLVYSLNNHKI